MPCAEQREVVVVEAEASKDFARTVTDPRQPCLIRGLPCGLAQHTTGQLIAAAGHRPVPMQYSVRRVARLDPRVNAGNYLRTMLPFADALHALEQPPLRGLTYVLASIDVRRWLPELDHAGLVPPMLDRSHCAGPYLFAGGEGTGTALHYDPTDNYLQVSIGAKDVVLLPPGHLRRMGAPPIWQPYCGVSRLDAHAVKLSKVAYQCSVEPGDVLFIPRNWWHRVWNRRFTVAVSVSPEWPAWSVLQWRQARIVGRLRFDDWIANRPDLAERVDNMVARLGHHIRTH